MPARYEFNELQGTVFGTNVTVSCKDVSSGYSVVEDTLWDFGNVALPSISKPGGAYITLYGNLEGYNVLEALAIGSEVMIDDETGDPTHVLAIPAFGLSDAFVLECT